jgi:hypothetical protein
MKPITSLFRVAVVGAIIASSFAAKASSIETSANPKVLESFENYFRDAAHVQWFSIGKDRLEAKFTVNEARETAFFDNQGELLAATRPVQVTDLPLQVSLEMIHEFPNSAVRYAVEYNSHGSTTYILTLESSSDWKTVRVNNTKEITVVKDLNKTFIK